MTDGLNCQTHTHARSVRKCSIGAQKKKKSNQICTHTQEEEAASKNIHCIQDDVLSSQPPTSPPPHACAASCVRKKQLVPQDLNIRALKKHQHAFHFKAACYMPTQEGSENRHMSHSSPRSASCLLVLLIGNMWSSNKQPMGALPFCVLLSDRLTVHWAAAQAERATPSFPPSVFSHVCVGDSMLLLFFFLLLSEAAFVLISAALQTAEQLILPT